MTHRERITRNTAELLYKTSIYDEEYCPQSKVCKYGFEAKKESCLECINKWLDSEVEE